MARSFGVTYEGLKLPHSFSLWPSAPRFGVTYEGLKRNRW